MKDHTEDEWGEARFRVGTYLTAMGVVNPEQQERLVGLMLERASIQHGNNPENSPTILAMDALRGFSQQWFENLLGAGERSAVKGIVSCCAIDAVDKWPSVILAEEIPADFISALHGCDVHAAPQLQVTCMVPQPFSNPLDFALNRAPAIGSLAKKLAPLLGKGAALLLSWLTFWPGNRLR